MKRIYFNKKCNVILIFAFLFFVQSNWGQTYSDDKSVNKDNAPSEYFTNFGFDMSPNIKTASLQGNSVFITQIGELNSVSALVESRASEINLVQNGDVNNVVLNYKVNTAVADLIQNGDGNRIKDFVLDRNADISLDLIQEGDNLNFERNGVNAITKSLKFKQTQASPTIIIRSFK